MTVFSFYLCIFRKFNKIFAQKAFRTCEGTGDAKSYKELDTREEQEVEWGRSGWQRNTKEIFKMQNDP